MSELYGVIVFLVLILIIQHIHLKRIEAKYIKIIKNYIELVDTVIKQQRIVSNELTEITNLSEEKYFELIEKQYGYGSIRTKETKENED